MSAPLRRPPIAVRPLVVPLFLLLLVGGVPAATAQVNVVEPGFVATTLAGDLSKQIEIGVGGDSCIYYGSFDGLKRRCTPGGPDTVCDPSLTFPAGIAFSTGGSFGHRMYVSDYGLGDVFQSTGCAPATLFADMSAPGSVVFPPAGSAYGDFLYACEAFEGPIYRVSPTGTLTPWLALPTAYLEFGPGGAWGTGLYATRMGEPPTGSGIVRVSAAAVVTPFVTGFFVPEGFDWAFDGDLFATDASAGTIHRVKVDGTKTLFATLPGAADVAWRANEQALYVVSNQGGFHRIARGQPGGVDEAAFAGALAVWPNPAPGSCALRFTTRSGGLVRAGVWDAAGRRVRGLGAAWRAGGAHVLSWDGHDDAGAPVPAGAYFVRVATGAAALRARVTVVR